MKPYVNYPFQVFFCIVTLLAFLWFTLRSSFAPIQQQKQSSNKATSKEKTNALDNVSTPFENTSEEKTETTTNDMASEYLRVDAEHLFQTNITIKHNKCLTVGVFVNFCCDSVSPPPEIFLC